MELTSNNQDVLHRVSQCIKCLCMDASGCDYVQVSDKGKSDEQSYTEPLKLNEIGFT